MTPGSDFQLYPLFKNVSSLGFSVPLDLPVTSRLMFTSFTISHGLRLRPHAERFIYAQFLSVTGLLVFVV